MSDSEWETFSPLALARTLGILSLIGIVAGGFDIGYVHSTLIVDGDVSATVHNIRDHEVLFRLGFVAHLVVLLCNIPNEVIGFILFKRVNAVIAATSACCGLVGTAVEGIDMLNAYVPLLFVANGDTFAALGHESLQTLSYTATQLQDAGLLIAFVFYGVDELLAGFLVFRSRFLPRILGILLGLAGFCYFTDGITKFLLPALHAHVLPYLLFPCLPGEGLFALWLATKGLDVAKWRAWTMGV